MDDLLLWLQAKIGPMTFGAISGFVLQVIIFRPTSWVVAAERAVAAVLMSVVAYQPVSQLLEDLLGIDRETSIMLAATLLSLGGIELLRAVRGRIINTASGEDKNG